MVRQVASYHRRGSHQRHRKGNTQLVLPLMNNMPPSCPEFNSAFFKGDDFMVTFAHESPLSVCLRRDTDCGNCKGIGETVAEDISVRCEISTEKFDYTRYVALCEQLHLWDSIIFGDPTFNLANGASYSVIDAFRATIDAHEPTSRSGQKKPIERK